MREGLLDKSNTASAVRADTAYRSKANEEFLEKNGFLSRVHRKKPPGRPMPDTTRRANAIKSKVRSGVEHVFAVQKDKMELFIRTIGIARATTKIGMANLVYNMKRYVYLDRLAASAWSENRPSRGSARRKDARHAPEIEGGEESDHSNRIRGSSRPPRTTRRWPT